MPAPCARDALSNTVVRVDAQAKPNAVLDLIRKHRASHIAVLDGRQVRGILTATKLLLNLSCQTIGELAVGGSVTSVSLEAPLEEIAGLLDRADDNAIAVTGDAAELLGVVTARSALRAIAASGSLSGPESGRPRAQPEAEPDIGHDRQLTSRQLMQNVLDSMFVFVGIYDLDGTLLEANRAPLEAAGLARDEVIGKPFWETYWWSYSPEVQQQLRSALREAAAGETVRYDVPVRIASERLITIDVTFGPLFDSEGNVAQLVGSAVDITSRKLAEEMSQRSERQLQLITDNLPAPIAYIDADQRYQFANLRFEDWFGVSPTDIVGKHIREIVGRENYEGFQHHVTEALSGRRAAHEESIRTVDGNLRHVVATYAPDIDGEGDVRGFLLLVHDITARKEAEDDARQHQAELAHVARVTTMGEMAARMAHELNQPLTAIANYVYAAQEDLRHVEPAGQAGMPELMEKLADQTIRAGKIIRRLRGFVRKSEPNRENADINELVREVVELAGPDARWKQVEFELKLDAPSAIMRIDGIQIQQVLLNLVRNAMDAMEGTEVQQRKIIISTSSPDTGIIEVGVRDFGKGMTPQEADSVFEAFYSTKPNGMGMGLAICRSIVEEHQGRLWVVSGLHEGAEFRFSLPVALKEEAVR